MVRPSTAATALQYSASPYGAWLSAQGVTDKNLHQSFGRMGMARALSGRAASQSKRMFSNGMHDNCGGNLFNFHKLFGGIENGLRKLVGLPEGKVTSGSWVA